MNSLSSVQTKNKINEVNEELAKGEFYVADTHRVIYTGLNNIKSSKENKIYAKCFDLLSYMETSGLTEPLPFKVKLTYIVLDALRLALDNFKTREHTIVIPVSLEILLCINPINFFKLLNDLSTCPTCTSSKEICDKYLRQAKSFEKIDKLYDEYPDIYSICQINRYSILYLFDALRNYNKEDIEKSQMKNILKLTQCGNKNKRHIACNLLTELLNEVKRSNISDTSREEYYYKMGEIDKNIKRLLKINPLNQLYCIDALYYSIEN